MYWIYNDLITKGWIEVKTSDIKKENWKLHYDSVLHIIQDYIETDYLKKACIKLVFDNGEELVLGLVDYWYNIIMWYLIVLPDIPQVETKIQPEHLFMPTNGMTRGYIKKYIDDKFIDIYRSKFPNITINNLIDNCMYQFIVIDKFSDFLFNTISLEECFINPMRRDKEIRDLLHLSLEDVSLTDAKKVAVDATNKLVEKIKKDKNNPLFDYFESGESVRHNQLREIVVSIAQKPNGHGGIYPVKIETSLMNGGVQDLIYFFIESSTGRTAQLMLENNVGDSGHLARLLGLNVMDTKLHPDPHYSCNTKNLVPKVINDQKDLNRFIGRYYRMEQWGVEKKITKNSTELIGKRILLRSPMTCASRTGDGVCYRCYGDLAYVNNDINIGRYASESISSKITQKMLSAKHLLEAKVKPFEWSYDISDIFESDINIITIKQDVDDKDKYICIDLDNIQSDDKSTNDALSKYIKIFTFKDGDNEIPIYSKNMIPMYLTEEFEDMIYSLAKNKNYMEDGILTIPISMLRNISLFIINILNTDLSEALDKFEVVINILGVTSKFTLEGMLEELTQVFKDIGINSTSVHSEILIANQIRNPNDILKEVDWSYIDAPYQIHTLDNCLEYNPSITKSLSFQYIDRQLVKPITYRKMTPSCMDLFFMEQPQKYLSKELVKRLNNDSLYSNI